MNILITGGAGFVGSRLAFSYREKFPNAQITTFDNLHRRGSEINLPLFKDKNIEFVHGDIRHASDFDNLAKHYDLFIEASAEPSVHAGVQGGVNYLVDTNLMGTINCLEFARNKAHHFVFLSTSRVYSIAPLRSIPLKEDDTRLRVAEPRQGVSDAGINEDFPVNLSRSLYGATKLSSEYFVQEYCSQFNLKATINRCGVIAGAGQFGKVDQGVFTLWVANHYFKKNLKYTGFGGQGKQVRDLLHPLDLFDLIELQRQNMDACSGNVYNIGGGHEVSTSLKELTGLCETVVGNKISIDSDKTTSPVDIPYYVSDCKKVIGALGWRPQRDVSFIVQDIFNWLRANESSLKTIFG